MKTASAPFMVRHISARYAESIQQNKKISRANKTKRYVIVFAACLVVVLAHALWSKHVAAEAAAVRHQEIIDQAVRAKKTLLFTQSINSLLSANPEITFSVSVITPQNDHLYFGLSGAMDAASTGKLITAVDYLHQIEIGKATLNQSINGLDAQDLLNAMIVNSDDAAWATLNGFLTHAQLESYATAIGLRQYDANQDVLPTADISQLLAKLYDHQLLNNAHRSLLLSYMNQANYRQFIVSGATAGTSVYHKIGLDEDDVNDAAILTRGSSRLVLVIFTNGNGTYQWDKRAAVFQTITRDAEHAFL